VAKKTTIRDVASRAGVGVGTVSRVLNDSPLVSESTRQKVTEAIETLNYRPNPVARQLSMGGRTLAIGIVAPFFTRPAFVGRLEGIEAALAQSEYDLILYNVETPEKRDSLLHRIPNEPRVDGLIVIALTPSDQNVAAFKAAGIPVILLDSYHPELVSIAIDDVDGGRQVAEYLIEMGHTHIGFVGDRWDNGFHFSTSDRRIEGCHAVMKTHGIPFRPAYHRRGQHGRHTAHRLTQELMALDPPPTAIFATSDTQALGVLEAIRQMKLDIPGDVSVVGYDDIEVASYVGLTTVHQPLYQSGVESVELLMPYLSEDKDRAPSALSQTLPVSLVVRETAAPPGG
jgi:LacI family transcriptional regulator